MVQMLQARLVVRIIASFEIRKVYLQVTYENRWRHLLADVCQLV